VEQAVEQVAEHGVVPAEINYPLPRFELIGTLHLIHRRNEGKFTLAVRKEWRERERERKSKSGILSSLKFNYTRYMCIIFECTNLLADRA
jgi:hypothetical protein